MLEHYTDEIVFQAPTVVARWGRVDGTLRGLDELRMHFEKGLELAPGLEFELDQVFASPRGYAMLYHRENGNRVVEAVDIDSSGKATRVCVYYANDQP